MLTCLASMTLILSSSVWTFWEGKFWSLSSSVQVEGVGSCWDYHRGEHEPWVWPITCALWDSNTWVEAGREGWVIRRSRGNRPGICLCRETCCYILRFRGPWFLLAPKIFYWTTCISSHTPHNPLFNLIKFSLLYLCQSFLLLLFF